MHIAVVTDKMLPLGDVFSSPTHIRVWGIGEGLKQAGLDVSYLIPEDTSLAKYEFKKEHGIHFYKQGEINRILKALKPDTVLVSKWQIAEKINRKDLPLIIDLDGEDILSSDLNIQIRKAKALSRGDFFICGSERQKWFFLTWLFQCGHVLSPDLIKVIRPFCPSYSKRVSKTRDTSFVSYWDAYQNVSFRLYHTVLKSLKSNKQGMLHIVSGTDSYQAEVENYFSLYENLPMKSNHLLIAEVFSWSDMLDELRMAHVGICLSPHSLKTEMDSPFLGVLYLSAGLPVVCNKGTEFGDLVEKYKAGWTVDISSTEDIEECISAILKSPRTIKQAARQAGVLFRDVFGAVHSLSPLIEFCQSPVKTTQKTTGLIAQLVDYSHNVLNMNNPLLNDIYIENILIIQSSSWEHLSQCLDAIDLMFPLANITIVCPTYLLVDDMEITPECNLILYEGEVFEPELIKEVLMANGAQRFDLGIGLFNNRYGEGYEPVKESLLCSGAKYKIGFTSAQNFVMIEDSIEKCITEVLDECMEIPEINNSLKLNN